MSESIAKKKFKSLFFYLDLAILLFELEIRPWIARRQRCEIISLGNENFSNRADAEEKLRRLRETNRKKVLSWIDIIFWFLVGLVWWFYTTFVDAL